MQYIFLKFFWKKYANFTRTAEKNTNFQNVPLRKPEHTHCLCMSQSTVLCFIKTVEFKLSELCATMNLRVIS